ncbi:MAG: hypothetical protein DSZ26_01720 [Thermovibrio sp.]|nr:MAG: hypothetical protein DSZ26_01720 [Thermovibrio sp.]
MVKSDLRKALLAVTLSALVAGCGSESGTEFGMNSGGNANYNPSSTKTYVIRGQVPLTRSTTGIAGIPVIAKEYNPVNPDSKVYRSVTDSKGNFEIKVDHPGTYVVMADGGRRGKAVKTVEVRATSNVVDLGQIHLIATGNIEGTLTFDEKPLAGAVVYIPGTSFVAIADKLGHFKISDVPVNTGSTGYKLVVKAPGYYEDSYGIVGILQLDPLTPQGIQIVKDIAKVEPHLLHYSSIYNKYLYKTNDGKEIFLRNFKPNEEEDYYDNETYDYDYNNSEEAPGFYLTFEKPMDVKSLIEAIQIIDSDNQTVQIGDKSELIELNGFGGWYEVYINTSKLSPGKYKLKIDKDIAKSIYGSNLAEDVEIPFKVGDIILGVYGNSERAGIDEPVEIRFSAPVNRESLINNLSVQDTSGNQPDGLKIYFEPDNMTAYISAVFKEGEKYTFTLDNGTLKSFDNSTFLNLPFEKEFSLVKPQVSLQPPWGSIDLSNIQKNESIRLWFNTLMDRDSVERGLKVIDETDNKTVDFNLTWMSVWGQDSWDWYYPQYCGDDISEMCNGEVADSANSDQLEISFNKEYGHTYKIVIENATSAKGTPLDKFEGEVTVLTPKFLGVDVQNEEIIEPFEGLEIRANVPISDKEGSYNIQFINLDDTSDVVPGILKDNHIIPEKPLKTDTKYMVRISKLQSFDGWDLINDTNPFTVTVQTFRKHIVGTFPHGGQSWVCDGNHHVVIDWNTALSDKEKEALKRYIKIDAYPYYSMGTGSTPTHPSVNVVFGTWGMGQTRMYIDFTWDPDTNYRVYFGDDNGTVLTKIPVTDDSGNVTEYLYPDKVVVFTTAPKEQYEKQKFITGTYPENGSKIDVYDQVTLTINTLNGWYSGNLPKNNVDLEIKECNLNGDNCTLLQSDKDYFINPGYYNNIYVELQHPEFYKKYEVTVKKLEPVYDLAKQEYIYPDGSDESTFYKFSFFTAGPKLWVSVNNADGRISFGGNALFNVKELKDNLKLQPQINCIWSDDNETSDDKKYVSSLTCYYNPIQYANIEVDISKELNAYEPEEVFDNATNSTTVQYNNLGKFENTPLSQVCTVNPDITLPKLEKVDVVENDPDGGYALLNLHFNERLDADSLNSANVTVTYQDGNNTVSVPVNGTQVDYCNDVETCVEPDVKLKLDDYIRPGVTYIVKVSGVKEFGGHYEITEEDGTKMFTYKGKVTSVEYAGYRYTDNGTNKYKFLLIADADVPLLENQTLTYDFYSSNNNVVNIDLNLEIDSNYSKDPDTVSIMIGGNEKNHLGLAADYTVSSDYYCSYCYEFGGVHIRNLFNSANQTLPDYSNSSWWVYIPSINNNIVGPTDVNATEDGIYLTFGDKPQECVYDPSIYKLLECDSNGTNCSESSITVVSVNVTDNGQYLLKTSSVLDNSTTYKVQVENLLSTGINFPCEALKFFGIEEVRESNPFQLSNVQADNGTQS